MYQSHPLQQLITKRFLLDFMYSLFLSHFSIFFSITMEVLTILFRWFEQKIYKLAAILVFDQLGGLHARSLVQ